MNTHITIRLCLLIVFRSSIFQLIFLCDCYRKRSMLKTSYEVSPFLIIIVYILAVCVLSLCCFLKYIYNLYIYIYDFCLFIFGCAGSSLLCMALSSCGEQGPLPSCGVQVSHCGCFSCCRAWALGTCALVTAVHRLGSRGTGAH